MTATHDRGAVDLSVQMLFAVVAVLLSLLVVAEAAAYWHARNVYDEAAAEGARVAAAFDGTCVLGTAAARAMVQRHGGGWASSVRITCTTGPVVQVAVSGRTPGFLGATGGFGVRVVETAPKEG